MSELKVIYAYTNDEIEGLCNLKEGNEYYLKSEADNVIAELEKENEELKQKLENVQATAYAESVDSGMRERRLKRELWLARAELCHRLDVDQYLRKHNNSHYFENYFTWNEACVAMEVKMSKIESMCRAKAEEYENDRR